MSAMAGRATFYSRRLPAFTFCCGGDASYMGEMTLDGKVTLHDQSAGTGSTMTAVEMVRLGNAMSEFGLQVLAMKRGDIG